MSVRYRICKHLRSREGFFKPECCPSESTIAHRAARVEERNTNRLSPKGAHRSQIVDFKTGPVVNLSGMGLLGISNVKVTPPFV